MKPLEGAHIPLMAGLLERLSTDSESLDAQRRRQLLREISKGGATRKRLATSLRMRAGSVTRYVAELIDAGLVRELQQIRRKEKGRPEVLLSCATGAIATIVVQALSNKIVANLVDLGGRSVCELSQEVNDTSITTEGMRDLIVTLASDLKRQASTSQLAGLVVSLPGIVNEASGEWLFSSRFPNAAPLSISTLSETLDMNVNVQRALGVELRAKLLRLPDADAGSTVLLHWGYGVGLASSANGAVQFSTQGAFGEIGHWRSFMAGDAKCRCGERGCLETQAALWSLVTSLQLSSSSEDHFARQLELDPTLTTHPLVQRATSAMAIAMRDVYLLLFPNRIIITGPFVQSPSLYDKLIREFRESLPHYVPDQVKTEVAVLSPQDEIVGAAKPLLHRALHQKLGAIARTSG